MPTNTVNVARPGRWGNPFPVELLGRDRAIAAFRDLMHGFFSGPSFKDLTDDEFSQMYARVHTFQQRIGTERRSAARYELGGKSLACWCAPGEACHADMLLEIANPGPLNANLKSREASHE